jgi:hypothetical protein
MLRRHCEIEGGTVSMLRASKYLLAYGANVLIVEFGSIHNFNF